MNLVYLCVCIFSIVTQVIANQAVQNETSVRVNFTASVDEGVQSSRKSQKWVSELMDEAKGAFNVSPANNSKCREDFQLYKLHLQNQSIWAMRSMLCFFWAFPELVSGGGVAWWGI